MTEEQNDTGVDLNGRGSNRPEEDDPQFQTKILRTDLSQSPKDEDQSQANPEPKEGEGDGFNKYYLQKNTNDPNAKELVPASQHDRPPQKVPQNFGQNTDPPDVPLADQDQDPSPSIKEENSQGSRVDKTFNEEPTITSDIDQATLDQIKFNPGLTNGNSSKNQSELPGTQTFSGRGPLKEVQPRPTDLRPSFKIDDCYSHLNDFLYRGKLVRDTQIKQCIYIQNCVCLIKNHWQDPRSFDRKRTPIGDLLENALKAKDPKDAPNPKDSQPKIPDSPEEDPEVTKVGIIGGGLMGKLLWQLLKDKTISGQRIELSMSTRVPERFFKEVIGGANIFFDNARIVKENDVVFLCAPKHCCNLIFSDIRAAYHARTTQTSRALIFSIVGNMPQTKLDKFLNSEKESLAISARLDFKKVEQSLATLQTSQENGEFVDITKISDQCAFKSYYNRAYNTKIWECMHLYTSSKHVFRSGPVFTGIIQLLKNTDNILNKHFYQKIYQKREADEQKAADDLAKDAVQDEFEDDFCIKIFGVSAKEFFRDKELARSRFLEPIYALRKTLAPTLGKPKGEQIQR